MILKPPPPRSQSEIFLYPGLPLHLAQNFQQSEVLELPKQAWAWRAGLLP